VLTISSPSYGTFLFNSIISPPSFLHASALSGYTAVATDDEDDEEVPRVRRASIVIEDREVAANRSLNQSAVLPADMGLGFNVIPSPVPKIDAGRRD
jgi:hypothetical protein